MAAAAVRLGEPADRERPAVALEVTPPRPLERRPKASGEPMVRPTKVMLPAAAVVALVRWVLGGFTLPMVTAVPHPPLRVAMGGAVSVIPSLEQRSSTVAAVAVEPTTIRFLRQRLVVMEALGAVERVPVPIEAKALLEQPIPAVVVVVAMQKARAGWADPVW